MKSKKSESQSPDIFGKDDDIVPGAFAAHILRKVPDLEKKSNKEPTKSQSSLKDEPLTNEEEPLTNGYSHFTENRPSSLENKTTEEEDPAFKHARTFWKKKRKEKLREDITTGHNLAELVDQHHIDDLVNQHYHLRFEDLVALLNGANSEVDLLAGRCNTHIIDTPCTWGSREEDETIPYSNGQHIGNWMGEARSILQDSDNGIDSVFIPYLDTEDSALTAQADQSNEGTVLHWKLYVMSIDDRQRIIREDINPPADGMCGDWVVYEIAQRLKYKREREGQTNRQDRDKAWATWYYDGTGPYKKEHPETVWSEEERQSKIGQAVLGIAEAHQWLKEYTGAVTDHDDISRQRIPLRRATLKRILNINKKTLLNAQSMVLSETVDDEEDEEDEEARTLALTAVGDRHSFEGGLEEKTHTSTEESPLNDQRVAFEPDITAWDRTAQTFGTFVNEMTDSVAQFANNFMSTNFQDVIKKTKQAESEINSARQSLRNAEKKLKNSETEAKNLRLTLLQTAMEKRTSLEDTCNEKAKENLKTKRSEKASQLCDQLERILKEQEEETQESKEDDYTIRQYSAWLTSKIWVYASKLKKTGGRKVNPCAVIHAQEMWITYLNQKCDQGEIQPQDLKPIEGLFDAVGATPADMLDAPKLQVNMENELHKIGFNTAQKDKIRRLCNAFIRRKSPGVDNQELSAALKDIMTHSRDTATNTKRFTQSFRDIEFALQPNLRETLADSEDIAHTIADDKETNIFLLKVIKDEIIVGIMAYINTVCNQETPNLDLWEEYLSQVFDRKSSDEKLLPPAGLNDNQNRHIQNFLTACQTANETITYTDAGDEEAALPPIYQFSSFYFDQLDQAIRAEKGAKREGSRFFKAMKDIPKQIQTRIHPFLISHSALAISDDTVNRCDIDKLTDTLNIARLIKDDGLLDLTTDQTKALSETARTADIDTGVINNIGSINYTDKKIYEGETLPQEAKKLVALNSAIQTHNDNPMDRTFRAIIEKTADSYDASRAIVEKTADSYDASEESYRKALADKNSKNTDLKAAELSFKSIKKLAHNIKILLMDAILQYITLNKFGTFNLHGLSGLTIACSALRKLMNAEEMPLKIFGVANELLGNLGTYNQGSLAAYIADSMTNKNGSLINTTGSFNTNSKSIQTKYDQQFIKETKGSTRWFQKTDGLIEKTEEDSSISAKNENKPDNSAATQNAVISALQTWNRHDATAASNEDLMQALQDDSCANEIRFAIQPGKKHTGHTTVFEALQNNTMFKSEGHRKRQRQILLLKNQCLQFRG